MALKYSMEKNESTMAELSKRYNINQNMITRWKKQLLNNSEEVFASKAGFSTDREAEIKSLQAKIGEIMEDNPELPYEFVRQAIIAAAEREAGKLESYDFG